MCVTKYRELKKEKLKGCVDDLKIHPAKRLTYPSPLLPIVQDYFDTWPMQIVLNDRQS